MAKQYLYEDQLQTARLSTRFLTAADIPAWTHFFEDKEATAFLSTFGYASCEDMSKFWIEKQLMRYQQQLYGLQALIHTESGAFVGQCGLVTQMIDDVMEMEIGYHIFKQYRRQGFATEAAKCFIEYAFANKLTSSVISVIDINNINSQKVAEKNGLIKERQTRWAHHDVYIYRIQNQDENNS